MSLQLLCASCGTLGQALGGFEHIFTLFSSSPHCFDFLQSFSLTCWSPCPLPTWKMEIPETSVTCWTRKGTVRSRHGCICANSRGRALGGWEGADSLQVTSHGSSSMLPHGSGCTLCHGPHWLSPCPAPVLCLLTGRELLAAFYNPSELCGCPCQDVSAGATWLHPLSPQQGKS